MHTWHRTMDDTDRIDVANEKSTGFEDGIGDPELEARLYAEIYFSNETYENNEEAEQTAGRTPGSNKGVTPQLSKDPSTGNVNNLNINAASLNEGNRPAASDFFYDYGNLDVAGPDTEVDGKHANYSVENTSSPRSSKNTERSGIRKSFHKQERLLTRKDLWLPKKTTTERTPISSKATIEPSKNSPTKTRNTPKKNRESIGNARGGRNNQMCETVQSEATLTISNQNNCTTEKSKPSKKKKEKKKKKNNQIQKEAPCGTKKQERCDNLLNNSGVTTNTSKYNIISKKMKLDIQEAKFDTLNISSDSDDSILEVPIPPKAQPPLIVLPDSDEDSDSNDRVKKKFCSSSPKRNNKPGEKSINAGRVTCEYDEPSTSHNDTNRASEISERSRNVEAADLENSKDICDDNDDLILNCSQPLADSPNVGENRIGTAENGSVDSVTEKGMANLAVTEADATENLETFPVESSFSTAVPENQESLDNSNAIDDTSLMINVQQNANVSCTENAGIQNENTKRKRHKDKESRSLKKNNMSETPGKKRKRDANSSSENNSMTDYFFKPMSNEMQAFYNSPCGSENMNVHDIQSRMPSHPSNWKILHVDLLPPAKKRGRVCPRCRNDTHHGRRCPEQASTPSCIMCGVKGHGETRCPQTMCLTCGHKYTSFRQTCCRCAKLSCDMCHGVGHLRQNCPDLWRRFHSTTTETLPQPTNIRNTMKDSQHLSCSNCAKRGHAAATCNQLRWSQHFPTPVYVSSYTEGPFYPAFQHEPIRRENNFGNIEVVDVPDNNDSIPMQITNEGFEPGSILQCGNLDPAKSTTFTVVSKRLDIIPNVHLDGLLAGDPAPTFLLDWLKHFTFNVNITQNPEGEIRLVIQANGQQLLHGIEKIVMQWLTRSELERSYMQHGDLPFGEFKRSTGRLKEKVRELNCTKDPKSILTSIFALAQNLQKESAAAIRDPDLLLSSASKSKRSGGKNRPTTIHSVFDKLIRARSRLVTSLYVGSWVEGGEVRVRQFRELVEHFLSYQYEKCFNSVRDYIDVVYLYNELFTYHESDALTRAMEALMVSLTEEQKKSGSGSLPKELFNTITSNLPRTHLENSGNNIINDDNTHPAFACSMMANNIPGPWSTPGNNVTTELMGTSYQTNIHRFNGPQMFSTPCQSDAFQSPNSGNTLLLNPCRKSKQKRKKKDLLTDLSRKMRNKLQRSATELMHLANTSDIPRLRKMADAVEFKIRNNSIRRSDIRCLKRAVAKRLNLKQKPTNLRKRGKSETKGR